MISRVLRRLVVAWVAGLALGFPPQASQAAGATANAPVKPPPIPRELRAAWIATVENTDWPSKRGLTSKQQMDELLAILDRAAELHLNALIFQVRPGADAFYASPLEPWSEYLSGEMGKAPEPFYDPLAFLIERAHARGIEIHAWFNPFRARRSYQGANTQAAAPNHISKTHPELVKIYGPNLWMDPAEPAVQARAKTVVLDVLKRYDIDGVHIDDYFYPYPETSAAGKAIDFPDEVSWNRYRATGGKLTRADWRRDNVNRFVEDLYGVIKKEKIWVKFGISPFGIWRPGFPKGIAGTDAYDQLYADARKWMLNGWADYFAPQLYWPIAAEKQSYTLLLDWWAGQNPKGRHLWPGSADYLAISGKIKLDEIVNQVGVARRQPGATGQIHYNMSALMNAQSGLAQSLRYRVYSEPALIPASPWLDNKAPAKPSATVPGGTNGLASTLVWRPGDAEQPWLWVLQTRVTGDWKTEIFPGSHQSQAWPKSGEVESIAITAIDRAGNASQPLMLPVGAR